MLPKARTVWGHLYTEYGMDGDLGRKLRQFPESRFGSVGEESQTVRCDGTGREQQVIGGLGVLRKRREKILSREKQ